MSHHAINKETNTNNCVITEKTYLNKIRKKNKAFFDKASQRLYCPSYCWSKEAYHTSKCWIFDMDVAELCKGDGHLKVQFNIEILHALQF